MHAARHWRVVALVLGGHGTDSADCHGTPTQMMAGLLCVFGRCGTLAGEHEYAPALAVARLVVVWVESATHSHSL